MDDDRTANYRRLFDAAFSTEENAETEPVLGELGGFVLLEKIGTGGMGVVWRARDPGTGREVALKQLRYVDAAAGGEERSNAVARFQREIALASRLVHPGIAQVYGAKVDEEEGVQFFTMELVRGIPLGSDGARNPREASELMIKVCEAVEHAHRNQVIHRDLKPGNILVTEGGNPKVLDFGVARAMEESEFRKDVEGEIALASLSLDGEVIGTPIYMSPEQARGETCRCDTRSDVYSLGTILYKEVTGAFPHDPVKKTNHQLIWEVSELEARRPAEAAHDAGKSPPDADLEAILMKAVAFRPDDRYGSAGELGRDLQRYLLGEPVLAQPLTASYWLRKHVSRHRKRWLAGAAILAALLVLVFLWSVQRGNYLAAQVELREKAEAGEKSARDFQVRSLVRLARRQAETGGKGEAIAMLAGAVDLAPENREARASLAVAVKQFSTVRRGSSTMRFKGNAEKVLFSKKGDWFALAIRGKDGGIEVRESESLEILAEVKGNFHVREWALSPKGDFLAALIQYRTEPEEKERSCLVFMGKGGVLFRKELSPGMDLDFSPDGRFLALAGMVSLNEPEPFCGAEVWNVNDPENPEITQPFRELNRPNFHRVHFSPDARMIYFIKGHQDSWFYRWDLESDVVEKTEMRAAPEGWRPLHMGAQLVSSDGRIFLGGQGEFVSMWRDHGDRRERVWMDTNKTIISTSHLALSADGRYLAGAMLGSLAVVWDADTGERLAELQHSEGLEETGFCPGKPEILATRTSADKVTLWNWKTGRRLAEPLEGGQRIQSFAFSPKGDRILVGRSGHARMWDLEPRKWEPQVVDCGKDALDGVAFTGSGCRLLATSHAEGKVHHVDGYSGEVLETWPHRTLVDHHRMQRRFLPAVSRYGKRCVTANSPRELVVRNLDPESNWSVKTIALKNDATALAITPNGRFLAVGQLDFVTEVYDLDRMNVEKPALVRTLKGAGLPEEELPAWEKSFPILDKPYQNFVHHLKFTHSTQRLVSVEFPAAAVIVWDWRQERRLTDAPVVEQNTVRDLQVYRYGEAVMVGGDSVGIRKISLQSGHPVGPLRFHQSTTTRLRVSQDSRHMMSGAIDGEVKFWDLLDDSRSRPVATFASPDGSPVRSMAICNNDFMGATGDGVGMIRLWLLGDGQSFADPIASGGGPVSDLAFHQRFPLLAAACGDGTVRLWEIPTGRGREPGWFLGMATNMVGLYLTDFGTVKPGAIYHFEDSAERARAAYEEHLEHRRKNPNFLSPEYHRLAFDILGLEEIPKPAWMSVTEEP